MDSSYSVTFNYYNGNKTLYSNSDKPLKEIFSEYAQTLGMTNQQLESNFFFLGGGSYVSTNSDKVISSFFGKNINILVFDKQNVDNDNKSGDQNTIMDTINNNQFKIRNCNIWNRNIIDTLYDMALLGSLTKDIIVNTIAVRPNSYMTLDEVVQKKNERPEFFVLGILAQYLNQLGIHAVISRSSQISEKYKNLSVTVLQFLFNGLIFKKKYYLSFELPEQRINQLLNYKSEQDNFKNIIISALNIIYGIPQEKIVVSTPIQDKYYKVIVLLNDDNTVLDKQTLMKKFIINEDLCKLIEVKQVNVIDGIILNKCMLDINGNTPKGHYAHFEERGGEEYQPPDEWDRYGLSVYNKYDNRNNDWLSSDNRKGEWCIGYSWLVNDQNKVNINYENANDRKHIGKKVGKGVYVTQNPDIMDKYTEEINMKNEKYKIGLMVRVNPEKIRSPDTNEEIWAVDGYSDEIRPYGILIKKIA